MTATLARAPQAINALLRIPLNALDPGPNVRAAITGITELATSIKQIGMQKPLLVIDIGGGRYRILDGHRRYAAAQRLGLNHIDVILRRDTTDKVRILRQLAIQGQTECFDPIAEASALHTLMWDHKMAREEIAQAVGRSPVWVRDRIALLRLTDDEKKAVATGQMPVGQALLILGARRAERDGTPAPKAVEPVAAKSRGKHCKSCTCGGAR